MGPTQQYICLSPLPPRAVAVGDVGTSPPEPEDTTALCDLTRQLRVCRLERQRVEMKLGALVTKASSAAPRPRIRLWETPWAVTARRFTVVKRPSSETFERVRPQTAG